MKLLLIGGTAFLGRHLVEAALARGHTVTLFNRGRTNWVRRVGQGGEMLVPDTPQQAWQIIDARDLAGWIIRMIEANQSGAYNTKASPVGSICRCGCHRTRRTSPASTASTAARRWTPV